ncbi:TetR/AcrR family transcriptional regulator [Nocardioides guangzhouensis]|uniref:TetR/AcrR family transcriptional regulator n=1 Tax=Nocardioides guangzhouensis TaxID=2497878 RepID=A0A4Q4ZH69_9ACTN|nr:TetR/AcrR family transcriptional regulator [Nocardioides guangzhouensis]RYP86694.1 TetR/AcrR family transcriptional regulator [Nocardioides guangzhouensis]
MSTTTPPPSPQPRPSEARERLLRTAADLFYNEGIHAVGVDRVLAEAGVTRATMYRHFPGKEALVAAYLGLEDATIRGYFAAAEEQSGGAPRDLVEAVVEGIAEDARRYHTRGCPFINAAAEYPDAGSEVRAIVRRHRDWFRATLADVLTAAGLPEPGAKADALVLLRDATLVGVYLDDGAEVVESFRRTARRVVGLDD